MGESGPIPQDTRPTEINEDSPAQAPTIVPQTPVTPRKIADRPHLWTILLSAVAIVVSSISLYLSIRSLKLNEAIDRPLVRVVTITGGVPALGNVQPNGPRLANSYNLGIRNSGKAFANNVKVRYKAQLEDMRCCKGYLRFSDSHDATSDSVSVGDLAPDDRYELSLLAYVLKDNPTIQYGDHRVNMVSLYIVGEIDYQNPINSQAYHETFCFVDAGTMGQFRRCSSGEPTYK